MSKAEFDAFVKREKEAKEKQPAFDPKQQLNEWLGYLSKLYKQIAGYLQDYVRDGTAHIDYRAVQLNEAFVGTYTAQELVLTVGRATVTFKPIATMLIGTKGRVDVEGPHGAARLLLVGKHVTNARQLIHVGSVPLGVRALALTPAQPARATEWAWKIGQRPPGMAFTDLTRDAFFDMVLAVANG